MRFAPEPSIKTAPKSGPSAQSAIIFCNLGTPDAPTTSAVRRYLAEFLGDHRVVEIPRPIWWLILHGVILRTRPAQSAAKYASVWTKEGSPLAVWTHKQALMLQGWLAQRGKNTKVFPAMRYGNPSIPSQLDAIKAQGIQHILVVTAYPQYSATTVASVFDAIYTWSQRQRVIPEFRFINQYHDHPAYIAALASSIKRYWMQNGRGDQLLMSFHGIPARNVELGDPYADHCQETARLLADKLGLQKEQYRVSFQSRLGRAKWLEPYTEPTLIEMGKSGVKRVDVLCPGFVSDCLETLEEINMEAREAFLHAGGQEFHYIPCMNDDPEWITALCEISQEFRSAPHCGK